jgi:hypothetical protein
MLASQKRLCRSSYNNIYSLIQYQYSSMHRRIFKSIDNHSENHADEAVVIELDLYV